MKKLNKIPKLLLLVAILFSACEGQEDALIGDRLEENPIDQPTEDYTAGDADFTNFVAIGNSLTAGFMDGALYDLSQQNSIPALMAAQLEIVGGTEDFQQPDINSENGYNTSASTESMILGRFKLDTSIPGPSPTVTGDPITAYSGSTSELNNFGVPGIKVGHLLTPLAAQNPFYARFASAPGTSTILGDAISAQPTFFSLWIGNNDVLDFARGGAVDSTALTSTADFQSYYEATITNLMSVPNLKGVVTTIPNILYIPYFQAISYNQIVLDEATAGALNQAFTGFNAALDAIVANMGHDAEDAAARKINYAAGSNPVLIEDDNLEDLGPKFDMLLGSGAISQEQRAALAPYEQARPITESEFVLLSAGTVLGTAFGGNAQAIIGVSFPLGDQYSLTLDELGQIEFHRQSFNGIIKQAVTGANTTAGDTRIAVYDLDSPTALFADIYGLVDGTIGLNENGVNLTPDFSPNGIFSTDGIHPNSRGNALLVNEMLEVIEDTFGAKLPEVNVLNLPSVQICAGDCVSQQPQS